MYVVDIKWEEAGLPTTVEVPIQLTEMEDIGTWLSYKYACQHDGFRLVESFKKIVNELLEVLEEVQTMYAVDIKWDTDDEDVDLPDIVKVPDDLTDGEDISDWLSDEYGFCHDGFALKEV